MSIHVVNGWWIDELYSLWASDGSVSFAQSFAERIAPDSNPPLYYIILYGIRQFIGDDRAAILILNVAAILIADAAVFVASKRMRGWALLGIIAFSLSGPVLCYVSEGRTYAMGMAIVFVVSWYVSLAIELPGSRPNPAIFMFLAILAALTHVYAAIFCGAISIGLLSVACLKRRRDLIGTGLILGLTVSIVLGVWLTFAWNKHTNLDWIDFSFRSVFYAVVYAKNLAIGGLPAVVFLLLILSFLVKSSATRELVIAFGVAIGVFLFLPLVASLKQPIIHGRYWSVGAPALVVLVVFGLRVVYLQSRRTFANKHAVVAGCGAVLFLATSSVYGFITARSYVASKPVWRGAEIVQPLLDNCSSGTVHIAHGDVKGLEKGRPENPFVKWAFSKTAKASPILFVEVDLPTTPAVLSIPRSCPVHGWAEQIYEEDFITRSSDEDLMQFLRINASPENVEVYRHRSGFVILKRER